MTAKDYLSDKKILAVEMLGNELFNILTSDGAKAIKREIPARGGIKLSKVRNFLISGDLLTIGDTVFDLSLIEVELSRKEAEKEIAAKAEEEELMKKLNGIISYRG